MDINVKEDEQKNLLILTPAYPNSDNSFIGEKFVKDQIAALSPYFKNIYVIAPVLYSFKRYKKDKMCHDYSYDNIKVFFPRCYYIPIFYFNKILIDNRLKVFIDTIERNGLNIDIIHAHMTWPSGYISAKLKEKYNVASVLTIHENGDWFEKEVNMNYPLINYAWEKNDVLIRVNKKDVPLLKTYNSNTYSIPNGYSSNYKVLDKSECREKLNIGQEKQLLFSVGNLIERKGFNFLTDAIHASAKTNPNILCVIGGSGPLKNKLQKQIDNLNINEHVVLTGFIPEDLLSVWMNASNVFVMPSLSESFGVVQIEAMACGKPVVATRNGGSEEIVTSDDYGLLVEAGDSQTLAKKIGIALDKTWDEEKIINYAKQYQWDNIAEQIPEIYETV
ncbi:glycosyltransferase [Methanohalophilus halophilus]|uniref:Glycosyl transferase family 1 n=1 Tax=Methanohalophilus halophilus TaxID=2177 RepID=A0A1L3Q107_9EURY|nr:glycosyltransferase [Methanohalophilus halophilus]APH38558.1 glycosyl transferase family 1 [Methanohalophilus halophilus]RNI08447.1 glycosyltransferase family 4 protein [Methanohalophilus halophilus]SDW14330.1 Glycosyltransferase involved in cell wall bisynthesis [Methanohalophilus halophilus]